MNSNDGSPNFLYKNLGGGRFKSVGAVEGIALTDAGAAVANMGCDFGDCRAHGCRCCRGWREQAQALSEQLSGERVDWRALNTCSTNVNA